MAIYVYTGRPGSGKTYILVKLALKLLKKGVPVWSNFRIFPDKKYIKNLRYWQTINDIKQVQNGVILMDEAQIYFNSRKWSELPDQWQYKLQQHRKEGLSIYGSVQNLRRLDTVMRELVSNYFECKKLFHLIFVREYNIEDAGKKQRSPLWLSIVPLRKKIYKKYDTLEKIF